MAKVTIDRYSVRDIRATALKALNDVLEKAGLKADLGRITYTPGVELRVKLTIVQPKAPTVATKPTASLVRGEEWMYAGKVYRIEQVGLEKVTVSRQARGKNAFYDAKTGTYRKNFLIKPEVLRTQGTHLGLIRA